MRRRRRQNEDGSQIAGAIVMLPDPDEPLVMTFAIPSGPATMEIAAHMARHLAILARGRLVKSQYMAGAKKDAPLVDVTINDLLPLLSFLWTHLMVLDGYKDEQGEPIKRDDIDFEEFRDIFLVAGYPQIVRAARAVQASAGLDKSMAKRLRTYLELQERGGCQCEKCTGEAEEDEFCELEPLLPLGDIVWQMNQHATFVGTSQSVPVDAPPWLVDIHTMVLESRARKAEEAAEFEAEKDVLKKHGIRV